MSSAAFFLHFVFSARVELLLRVKICQLMNTIFLSILIFTSQIPNASRQPRQNRGKMNGPMLSHQNGVQAVSYMQNSQDANQSVVTTKSSGNQQVNCSGLSTKYSLAFLCHRTCPIHLILELNGLYQNGFCGYLFFYLLGSLQFSCVELKGADGTNLDKVLMSH